MSELLTALTGTQKVAVVLMQMEQARAAEVMKRFSEAEAEQSPPKWSGMRRVDPEVAEEAFEGIPRHDGQGPHAGPRRQASSPPDCWRPPSARRKRPACMDRLATSMAGKPFEFLDEADPSQLITLLGGEMPQTIALVLAHMRPEQASAVIAGPRRSRSAPKWPSASPPWAPPRPEAVTIVAETLKVRAGAVVLRQQVEVVGGVQPLVDIINRADAATERALLEALDERDPELAEEVRSRMLTFEDIAKLEPRDVQQVLRGIEIAVLAVAMKGASRTGHRTDPQATSPSATATSWTTRSTPPARCACRRSRRPARTLCVPSASWKPAAHHGPARRGRRRICLLTRRSPG